MNLSDVTILFAVAGKWEDRETKGQILRAISRRVCNCNIEILPLGGSRESGKWFSSRLTCEPQSPMLGNIYWNIFTGISKLYQNNNKILLPQISFRNVACEVAHRGKCLTHKPDLPSLIPGTPVKEPQLLKWSSDFNRCLVALGHAHITHTHAYIHTHTYTHIIANLKKINIFQTNK